jgi:fructose-bisphosphate aldolase class II
MKITVAVLFLAASVEAFAPATAVGGSCTHLPMSGMSNDVGIPCEDECALESFPNLPPSVHPGVLSGQAMMDLLNHAKENGACDEGGSRWRIS